MISLISFMLFSIELDPLFHWSILIGSGRLPTKQKNYTSASEYGARVADALAEMISQKIVVGPLTIEEVPWEDISISPTIVHIKPYGKQGSSLTCQPHTTQKVQGA